MKRSISLFLFAMFALCINATQIGNINLAPNDTLCFHYYSLEEIGTYNTPDMCDKVILIIGTKSTPKIWYYGTDDEFTAGGEENILPGFTALEAYDVIVDNENLKIRFRINSSGHNYYSSPINIGLMGEQEIERNGYKRWLQLSKYFWEDIYFEADISDIVNGVMTIQNKTHNYDPKRFCQESMVEIRPLYNKNLIDPAIERRNNIDYNFAEYKDNY